MIFNLRSAAPVLNLEELFVIETLHLIVENRDDDIPSLVCRPGSPYSTNAVAFLLFLVSLKLFAV